MKRLLLLIVTFACMTFASYSQNIGIVKDWAMAVNGNEDTTFHVPVYTDADGNIYTVGFLTSDTISGVDIVVTKFNDKAEILWQRIFTGVGNYRDQATCLAGDDSANVYVGGFTYVDTLNNYDFVVLRYDSSGNLQWTKTFNGTASNYDGATCITVDVNNVYVTGGSYSAGTSIDMVTISYNRISGDQNWVSTYDHAALYDIPIAMVIGDDGKVLAAGGSQNTLTSWDYVVLGFDTSDGTPTDTIRGDGTGSAYDRAQAVKCDRNGNIYFTGGSGDTLQGLNIKTIKMNAAGTILWTSTYNTSDDLDDVGNDLIVDDSGYVYVCGQSRSSVNRDDMALIKYKWDGHEEWVRRYDAHEDDDAARKMCFDAYGNIIITGESMNSNYNFVTIAYAKDGLLLWKDFYDGEFHGDDKATGIAADINGYIYVTGQSQVDDSTYQQITIKYRTDYYTKPIDTTLGLPNLLFYPNAGQIIDTQDSVRNDVYYYTINQYPKLYFTDSSAVDFVFVHADADTAIADTLERIDMSFVGGNTNAKQFQNAVHDSDQILNYFLGHCPNGVTNIQGSEHLISTDVYDNIDVFYGNNSAGMKFYIIVNPTGEPSQIVLHFEGAQSVSIQSGWNLHVVGLLGSFDYEKPRVSQINDTALVTLPWQCSYVQINSTDIGFSLGSYDTGLPLVIECSRLQQPGHGGYSTQSVPPISRQSVPL
jgi:hypothetical protein